MRTQEFLDKHYLRLAKEISNLSYAIRRKVGCIIVKDRQIISDGYNGTPKGFANICERAICHNPEGPGCPGGKECFTCKHAELVTLPYVLHAETNAITKVAKSNLSIEGSTIYITDEPCFDCAKLIIQSGIKEVVYLSDKYNGTDANIASKKLFDTCGVKYRQLDEKSMKKIELDLGINQ